MGRPRKHQYMEAREAATGIDELGDPFVLKPGEVFAAEHPIVKRYPDFFRPLAPERQRPQVEQMTAGPGEVRGAK